MTQGRWTEKDFDALSWHDNAIHSFHVVEGESGAGELVLDIDYILEWRPNDAGGFLFLVAPATLTFHGVSALRVAIDYATPTAAIAPLTIDRIERSIERRDHYQVVLWKLPINWPTGEISFEATGFLQELRGVPVVSQQMSLPRSRVQTPNHLLQGDRKGAPRRCPLPQVGGD